MLDGVRMPTAYSDRLELVMSMHLTCRTSRCLHNACFVFIGPESDLALSQ